MRRHPILWVVIAELLGTSLWFSANAAADSLRSEWGLTPSDLGWLTNSVQLGFIVGSLASAVTGLADRVSSSRLFAGSCVVGAVANSCFALFADGLSSAMILRFIVGISLAGIYPLGMKMAVGWDPRRAGSSLGMLVAMLTLGTALPHAVRAAGSTLPWAAVVLTSSALAVLAALIALALGDGPHLRGVSASPSTGRWQVLESFRSPVFRASAFGYFGHMWELYAFWTLVPILVSQALGHASPVETATWSFAIIATGSVGSVAGGLFSHRDPRRSLAVARVSLVTSGLACAAYPIIAGSSAALALVVLLVWGLSVIPDSPQFAALSSQAAPAHLVGTALTIQNSIGFAITTVSISVSTALVDRLGPDISWVLLIGPVLGLLAIGRMPRLDQHLTSTRQPETP